MDYRDRPDPADRLIQRRAGLGRLQPPGLQPQQRGDGLQVVLHPVVDLPDRRVLGHQLALAVAHLGHVPDQDQGPGPGPADDQRDRTELDHRAVHVHLGGPRRPARGHHHQRLVQRLIGRAQPGGDQGQLRADQVGGQAQAAVGRLRVRAGVADPPGFAEPEQPVTHPRRPDQHGRLAGEGERPLGHHPGQVIGALQVSELEPAGGAGRTEVGAPCDDGDDPARPGHGNGLGPDRDAVRPVRVALPPDAPFGAGDVQQTLVFGTGHGPDHVILERRGTGRRPHLGQGQPAAVVADRRPQDQVGEGQVGQQLPVRDQRMQPLHVGVTERGAARSQVVQRRHSTIIASVGQRMSAARLLSELTLTLHSGNDSE